MTRPIFRFRLARETRLLLLTIVVSAATLLALAQFRFPNAAAPVPELPREQPLERLAAEAAFEDMAAVLTRLRGRIAPFTLAVRAEPLQTPTGGGRSPLPGQLPFAPAFRLRGNLAVVALPFPIRARLVTTDGLVDAPTVAHDGVRGFSVVRVPGDPGTPTRVQPGRSAGARGAGYAVAVEAGPGGPLLRPVFVDRLDAARRPPWLGSWAVPPELRTVAPGALIVEFDGELLGIVTAAREAALVPVAALSQAAEMAIAGDAPAAGAVGIELQTLDPAMAEATGAEHGVAIAHVDPAGPAAGLLLVGDVILSVGDEEVLTPTAVDEWVRATGAGASLLFRVQRREGVHQVEVPVVAVPEGPFPPVGPASSRSTRGLGMNLRAEGRSGVRVIGVARGSAAASAGLLAGDLLLWIAGNDSPSPADVRRLFAEAEPGSHLLVSIVRDGRHRLVALEKR